MSVEAAPASRRFSTARPADVVGVAHLVENHESAGRAVENLREARVGSTLAQAETAAVKVETDDGLQHGQRRDIDRDLGTSREHVRQVLEGPRREQEGTRAETPAGEQLADDAARLRHEETVAPSRIRRAKIAKRQEPRIIGGVDSLDGHGSLEAT